MLLEVEEFNGHKYKYYNQSITWDEAQAFCEKLGGHLVIITSAEENDFVHRLAQGANIWLGGTDTKVEGTFEWISGEALTYSNWAPGEPNNGNGKGNQDYMHMYSNGIWDDVNKDIVKTFVCEWDEIEIEPTIEIPLDSTNFEYHYYKFYTMSCDCIILSIIIINFIQCRVIGIALSFSVSKWAVI